MKLRIRGNSIRLRLGQSEVQRLLVSGSVEESTAFGPSEEQRFSYSLYVSLDLPDVSASFADGRIIVRVPMTTAREWVTTDQVSIDAIQPNGDDGQLRILIEKDFACIDAPGNESQEDAFPHPLLTGACAPANPIERSA
jgi:hypothetical protein